MEILKLRVALIFGVVILNCSFSGWSQNNAWINEIHYDNQGVDINEGIEVVIENVGNLSDYQIYLYRESDGTPYDNISLNDSNVSAGETIGNFSFYTWFPSNGIQNGPADGVALVYDGVVINDQFLSYEGTLNATTGPATGMTSVDIAQNQTSTDLFYQSLQLTGSGLGYSDFSWAAPAQNSFGYVNTGQTLNGEVGNAKPVIFNISQFPLVANVTPDDKVFVSAEIYDLHGISTVTLNWGTASGVLTNSIPMVLTSGNTYKNDTGIPEQLENTTIFYQVVAVDNHNPTETNSSQENNYIVGPAATKGWQITQVDVPFKIDFETEVAHVNKGQFDGSGFQPVPVNGQLDSNSWKITGFDEGDLNFEGNQLGSNTDFTRGVSVGGVTPGGIYAFKIGTSICLGVQSSGADFTPGTITLKLQNKTGATINELKLDFDIFVHNNENRSSRFNLSYSDDGINFTNGVTFSSEEAKNSFSFWKKFEQQEDITSLSIAPNAYYYLKWTSEDVSGSGSRDEFGLDNIQVVANPVSVDFVYNNGWLPSDPNGIANSTDNISVIAGVAIFQQNMEINNLTVSAGATLKVGKVLEFHGSLTNNGSLVFLSDENNLGQLAPTQANGTISGVTVQRYIPKRRAFRFVSTAVTTTTNIHDNWQEGAVSNSSNPNPGFGTHITGTLVDQTNGFDATGSGDASLFLFNETTQAWNSIANTDVLGLEAGKAYRLFVRGDRSTDLTTNTPTETNTTLRATGNMKLGNFSNAELGNSKDDYNFIGNPFQAIVDMNEVLENSTNLNAETYYAWDPNIGGRGGYVVVDLPTGTNSVNSKVNQFLQPGQAFFVQTLNNGSASILFEESDKAVYQHGTDVFRAEALIDTTKTGITMQLFKTQNYLTDGPVADGVQLNFKTEGNNNVLPNDAPKMGNLDENFAVINGDSYLSISNRALPINEEIIQLFLNQYRHINYTFRVEVYGFAENTSVFLKDEYQHTQTELMNNAVNLVDFEIDQNIEASSAFNRFSLLFNRSEMAIQETTISRISIYPNPVKNDRFFVDLPSNYEGKTLISVYDLFGQKVYEFENRLTSSTPIEIQTPSLPAGVYMVRVQNGDKSFSKKVLFF